MGKKGHKISEYVKLPKKRKWNYNPFRDGFYLGPVDPLVKKKEDNDILNRYRDDRIR